jgi:CheY-like chemotaxis protein
MNDVSSKFVLIADDYDAAVKLIAELLECGTPYETKWAKDGQEAFDLARERWPYGCLLDIDMPRLNGVQAARQMRELFHEHRPLLIAMTGRADTDAAVLSGVFDRVLKKPVEISDLVRALSVV